MPTTTAQKLKIREADILLTLHPCADFKKKLAPLPAKVKIIASGDTYNQLHWFVTSIAQVEKEIKKVLTLLKENILCWIYFPKGTSKIQTDLTRDKGWDSLMAHNDKLTWISLVAFDETWSAFAFRLKTAADTNKKSPGKEAPILQYIDVASKTVRLPEDLAGAFKSHTTEEAFFNTLSYTNRKEFVEWVVTAKQEATRKTRVEGTMERLAKQWKNPRNL